MNNTYIELTHKVIDKYKVDDDIEYTIKNLTELFTYSELLLGVKINKVLLSALIENIIMLDRDYDDSSIDNTNRDILLNVMEYSLDVELNIDDKDNSIRLIGKLLNNNFYSKLRAIMPVEQCEIPYSWRYNGDNVSLVSLVITDDIKLDTLL